ncbi:hypothetical protein [Rhodopila sp.]|uniref:hypothetical protein n=1 Tax=Rhodopila sp. TaxID=2480087 RepID=UPI003D0F4A1E
MIRPVRLARIAAEAEGVRLRAMATRYVTRILLAVVALLFVLGALVIVHFMAWYALRVDAGLSFYAATGIVLGVDLLIAVVLGVLASRSGPGRVEREALGVRRQAITGLGSMMSLTQLAVPALRVATGMRRRKRRI